jgi:Tetracyclin repressor-like, C-terminal domain
VSVAAMPPVPRGATSPQQGGLVATGHGTAQILRRPAWHAQLTTTDRGERPSKGALVHEAVFQRYPSGSQGAPDTGSLLGDVRALVALVQEALTTPEALAAIPGLLGEMAGDPILEQRLQVEWYAPMRAGFATVMAQARRRGQRLRRTPPGLVADTLVGTLLWRCAFVGLPEDTNLTNQLAALLVGGLDRGDQP